MVAFSICCQETKTEQEPLEYLVKQRLGRRHVQYVGNEGVWCCHRAGLKAAAVSLSPISDSVILLSIVAF